MTSTIDKRRLPPINLLIAFEAAARLGSFAQAGTEVHLSASAISRQVKSLEEHLGVMLFERVRQRVQLTEAGRFLAVQVRQTLGRLLTVADQASQLRNVSRTLNIGILPAFANYWLIPRLPGFVREHPNILFNLISIGVGFDYENGGLDAAIHTNAKIWADTVAYKVGNEEFIAVASPEWIANHDAKLPADLPDKTLLVLTQRPYIWSQWFQHNSLEVDLLPRLLQFGHYSMVFEAAIASLGVALVPRILAHAQIAAGRLAEIPGRALAINAGYFLVHPIHHEESSPLQQFRKWLLCQVEQDPT